MDKITTAKLVNSYQYRNYNMKYEHIEDKLKTLRHKLIEVERSTSQYNEGWARLNLILKVDNLSRDNINRYMEHIIRAFVNEIIGKYSKTEDNNQMKHRIIMEITFAYVMALEHILISNDSKKSIYKYVSRTFDRKMMEVRMMSLENFQH